MAPRRSAWGRMKVKWQMLLVYVLALMIPLAVVGMILLSSAGKMLDRHYQELLMADNRRVATLMTEVTRRIYSLSDEMRSDRELQELLTREHESYAAFVAAANTYTRLDTMLYSAREIGRVAIYTDNPTVRDLKQFHRVTAEVADASWYRRAVDHAYAFWVSIPQEGSYTDAKDNLSLVRSIRLPGSEYEAVLVVTVSDAYIRTRVDMSGIEDAISLDDGGVVYASRKNWYAQPQMVDIDTGEDFYRFSGKVRLEDGSCFAAASTIHLYMTGSKMYVCTLDSSNEKSISRITFTWGLTLLLAVLLPGIALSLFVRYFSGRVSLLRQEMHKARSQNYNIISDFSGNDELTEVFEDLKFMAAEIRENSARLYEAELNEKEFRAQQQRMEYRMLASQINPHYLYNTLETIRMKALTGGNREVADSIKVLGKTLHYVLENTGTAFTVLQKELDHVENYLYIQKLRFGERINYTVEIMPGVDTNAIPVLPLLLQPVVENAVTHGLEAMDGVGVLQIIFYREDGLLKLTVADNGIGMTADELAALRKKLDTPGLNPQTSVGLYNIHQRIRLCYGPGCGVTIESERGHGTMVTLNLPGDFRENT